jgi:uncharacterized protein
VQTGAGMTIIRRFRLFTTPSFLNLTEYFERDISGVVLEALKDMPVVVVTGMRQTGKTTLPQRQRGFEHRRYVTLDDFTQLAAAKSDPDLFVASDEPLSIDEAHKCPELLTAIKKVVDRQRIPGQFLLSGSANFLLLKGAPLLLECSGEV